MLVWSFNKPIVPAVCSVDRLEQANWWNFAVKLHFLVVKFLICVEVLQVWSCQVTFWRFNIKTVTTWRFSSVNLICWLIVKYYTHRLAEIQEYYWLAVSLTLHKDLCGLWKYSICVHWFIFVRFAFDCPMYVLHWFACMYIYHILNALQIISNLG